MTRLYALGSFMLAMLLFVLIFAASLTPVEASTPTENQILFGCEMKKADNGNYFIKVDPGCQYQTINGLDTFGNPDAK